MKKNILLLMLLLIVSCAKDEAKPIEKTVPKEKEKPAFLPFTNIELNDLSEFKATGENWQIAGDVIADKTKEKTITNSEGNGILLNKNDQAKNKNLFTKFEHGDIEIEFDVMMPLKSNSGVYFQGRYEIQLLDSWGVKKPKYGDIGGIYQRWNKDAKKGNEGYEGNSPRINAAKAPGLWQHMKVIFHAPQFDNNGNKTKNAWFEEVWLNGVLLHKNIEVTGPTRAAAFGDEKPRGPIMIQGDHGPVAFKNMKYKLYEGYHITLGELVKKEYESNSMSIGNLDTIPLVSETPTNSFSLAKDTKEKAKKMIVYLGTITIPKTGEYLFDGRTNGISELSINNETILKMRGDMDRKNLTTINLEEGTYPFKIIYNQNRPWMRGFNLFVEGPNMQKYSLQEGVNLSDNDFDPLKGIIVEPTDKPITQRSFINHEGKKYTHCISVGTPKGIHYSYNLATGSLLKAWNGSFLNTTHMWLSRGKHQLGEPIGFAISLHGDLEFAILENDNSPWPMPLPENKDVKQLGYEFDASRMPSFSYEIENSTITNSFTVSDGQRQLNRSITVSSDKQLWHKLADGENIKALPNHLYIVNNESYYIDLSNTPDLKPVIRTNNGKEELLIQVPKGSNTINYNIIW